MLDSETKRRINSLKDTLVGKIPTPMGQAEQITLALIYKFMSDIDDKSTNIGGNSFFSNEYSKYSWSNILNSITTGSERSELYREGLEKMSHNPYLPQLFRDIFRGAFMPFRDPETISLFLKQINDFNYDHSEDLGDAFEYLLLITGSQGNAGQFRTPRHIIDFIVNIVEPQKNDRILDPACGTAGFLISAYKFIRDHNKLTEADRKNLTANFTGYDISHDMVRLSRVNMYLHHFPDPQIYEYDTLTSEERWKDKFDVILANPPFMTPKGGIKPHNRFAVNANRAEVLFADYIMEHLSPKGRAGVIVPEGIIFQSANAYKDLRKMMVEDNYLWAVVSLPGGVFQPYSGVKTSILLFDREIAKKAENILFVKIENDGFDLGAQRHAKEGSQLTEAYEELKNYKEFILTGKIEHGKVSRIVNLISNSKDNISSSFSNFTIVKKERINKESDYNLSAERYKIEGLRNNQKWPMVKLKNISVITSSKRIFQKEYVSQGIPFYRTKEIVELSQNKPISIKLFISNNKFENIKKQFSVPREGDILVSAVGTIGISWVVTGDKPFYFKDGNLLWVKNIKNTNSRYLKLMLDYFFEHFKGTLSFGAAYNALTIIKLKEIEIPLPPLTIQQEIVEELDSYQKIIDGAKMVVENWKPRIKLNSEWETVKLEDVCEKITDGSHFSPESVENGEYPYITVKDLNDDGVINFVNCKFISRKDYELLAHNGCNPKKGDVLFSKDGTVGKVSLINFAKDFVILSSLAILTPRTDAITSQYLYYLMKDEVTLNKALEMKGGSAIKRIILRDIKAIKINLPPLEIQDLIVSLLEAEHKVIESNNELIKIYQQKIKNNIEDIWK